MIAERYPQLTGGGFPGGEPHVRASLLDHQAEFAAAMRFLATVETTPEPNSRFSSYSLKNRASEWTGEYVSNGAMIAALIACGVPIKLLRPGSPNVVYGICPRWLRRRR